MRVLLIGKNARDLGLVQNALSHTNETQFVIEAASTVDGALARMQTGGIDVILYDLDVAGADALRCLRLILACASTIPVVVLTGYEEQHLGVKAIAMGARDYRVKNIVDLRLLLKAVSPARPPWVSPVRTV